MAWLNLARILKFKVFKGMFGLGEKEERKLLGVGFFFYLAVLKMGGFQLT